MFSDLNQKFGKLVADNASVLLTAGGVVGTVATALLTGRAVGKAHTTIEQAERKASVEESLKADHSIQIEFTKREKAVLVGPMFIPPVVVGGATIGSIIMANRISAQKAAALAAAYGLSERSLKEYKEKTLEKFGVAKEQKLREEVAQDRVNANPVNNLVIVGNGEVLCYDMTTDRYFQSSVETIKKAETAVNGEIYHHMYASLSMFYDELGLKPTPYTNEVGWNADNLLEVHITTTMSSDKRPCLAIDFATSPKPDYHKLHS